MGVLVKTTLALAASLLLLACARQHEPATPAAAELIAARGEAVHYHDVIARAQWTVFVFVASECPCLDAHAQRLAELATAYRPRGVQFVAVDSEVDATPQSAARSARELGLPFDVVVDRGARLADAFGAEYATYSVLVSRAGRVVYRGGVDSDKRKLHANAVPYVRDALDDVLAGRPPRRREGKALGCTLRKW